MKINSLLQTSLIIGAIITAGFATLFAVNYRTNMNMYEEKVEHISNLTSDSIYSQIDFIFSKPVHISLTMANDNFLKNFLNKETLLVDDELYIKEIREYLHTYWEKYKYDSVFLVSTGTNRYYHFNGIDRILTKDNKENVWYYDFLKNDKEYSLNVDNDEATDNSITVFVNCKVKDKEGKILGVVGVGFRVNTLQKMFQNYDVQFDVKSLLVNTNGLIEVSSVKTKKENMNIFDMPSYSLYAERILANKESKQKLWYTFENENKYIVTQYVQNLNWYLVVVGDVSMLNKVYRVQLFQGIIILIIAIILVLYTVTFVINKYNAQIIKLTISQEFEYQRLLRKSTEELYENIHEYDLTRNKAAGESTEQYFESLAIGTHASYDDAVHVVGNDQVKEEYRALYLENFQREHILKGYENGIRNLSYDFMQSNDGETYCWMRINAQIFFWNSDQSIRMITYCKNIDEEKKREFLLVEASQKDPLTGVNNKRATASFIVEALKTGELGHEKHALCIFDIDHFKAINDTYGHAVGDEVIVQFATALKMHFRSTDIVGRVGGDEFIVCIKNYDQFDTVLAMLDALYADLNRNVFGNEPRIALSTSIGIALFPEHGDDYPHLYEKSDVALYYSKTHGRGRYTLFGTFHS